MQTQTERCLPAQTREVSQTAQHTSHVFAKGLCKEKLFWIFFIGCFVGVVLETTLCLINNHALQSRVGVLYGPFNPVYGVGAVLMTVALYRIAEKGDGVVFVGSALVGGVFEYVVSYMQESLFGTVSWDYSHMLLNIHGRTNLLYMLFWGMLGVVWMRCVFPALSSLIERIPIKWGQPLTFALAVFMLVNITLSALAVNRQAHRRIGIPPTNPIQQLLDEKYPDDYLAEVFPSMSVVGGSQGTTD